MIYEGLFTYNSVKNTPEVNHKKECEGRYTLDDKECEECPYHYKCEFEQQAWDDVIFKE